MHQKRQTEGTTRIKDSDSPVYRLIIQDLLMKEVSDVLQDGTLKGIH